MQCLGRRTRPTLRWCFEASGRDVAALPLDFRDLGRLAPAANGPGQRVTGTFAPAVPIDLGADALQRDIAWLLGVWEPPVREAAGLPPAPELRIRPGRLVARAAAVLSAKLSDFLALGDTWGYPDGLEAGCVARSGLYGVASLRRLHSRAQWALGLTEPVTHVPGMCSRCGSSALTRTTGSDAVSCGHCGLWISDDEYRAYVGMETAKAAHHPSG